MKRLFVLLAMVAMVFLSTFAYSQVVTNKLREDLIGSTVESCFRTQRNDSVSNAFSDDQIRRYCSCFARLLFPKTITKQDLNRINEALLNEGEQAALRATLNGRDLYTLTNRCAQEAVK